MVRLAMLVVACAPYFFIYPMKDKAYILFSYRLADDVIEESCHSNFAFSSHVRLCIAVITFG